MYDDYAEQQYFALVADPRQIRRDRRDVARDPQPVRPKDRDHSAVQPRPPSRNHDAATAGSAQVQPTVASLEVLMSQIQSAIAQLKNAEKSAMEYKATPTQAPDSPAVHYALHARVAHRQSSRSSDEDSNAEYHEPAL